MFDFSVLKAFHLKIKPPMTSIIRDIFWNPLPIGWMKCNVDGSFVDTFNSSGCGGLFRKSTCEFFLTFIKSLNWGSSLLVEFCGVLCGIKLAKKRG